MLPNKTVCEYRMIQNFGGRKVGETIHIKNWQIMFWRMPKITKVPKIIIMCQHFTYQLES